MSDGLKECSIKQRQIHEKFDSLLNAALKSGRESLEEWCDDLVAAAVDELQGGKLGTNCMAQTPAQEVPEPRRSIFSGNPSSHGIHSDHSIVSSRIATVKVVEDDEATNSTASSPRAPNKALKKRSAEVKLLGEEDSIERNMAKKIKIAGQKSPGTEEETAARIYPAFLSLVAGQRRCYVLEGAWTTEPRWIATS